MLNINISTWVRIAGCPSTGLEALDYRRAQNLAERCDDRYGFTVSSSDECAFRLLVAAGYKPYSRTDGSLTIDESSFPYPEGSSSAHGSGWRAEVDPETLKSGGIAILLAIAADSPAKQDARRAAEESKKAKLEALSAARAIVAKLEAELGL